jgi:3-phenylpropionate/trans-cinnamate dioxygenase ferredoxin component
MNQTHSREELEQLSHAELKKLAAELEMEGAQIKETRHYFIDEFWRRIEDRPIKVAELSDGEMAAVRIGNKPIVFAKVEDKIYAFNDRCPHKGFPLHKGSLEGHTLTCAYHGGKFDIRSGQCLKHPYATYPCQSFAVDVAQDGTVECK